MLNENTLSRLLNHIEKVQLICSEKGLKNLRLYSPGYMNPQGRAEIYFLSTSPTDEKFNLFTLQKIEKEICNLLKCNVRLVTEKMLRQPVEEICITSYSTENSNGIKEFFQEVLNSYKETTLLKEMETKITTSQTTTPFWRSEEKIGEKYSAKRLKTSSDDKNYIKK